MLPFSKCPVCGGEVVAKRWRNSCGGNHTAVVTVQAEVCLHCGERLYSQETVRRFGQIRAKLAHRDISDFQPLGQSFRASA